MKVIFLFFLLILFLSGCSTVSVKNSVLKTYARGVISSENEEYDKAIKYFEETLKKGGQSSYINLKLGNLYLKKKQPEKAKKYLYRAKREKPDNPQVYFGLAVAYLFEKNNRIAAYFIEKGLEKQSDNNNSFRLILCDLYVSLKKYEKAAYHYSILVKTFPSNYLLHYNYAKLLEKIGDYNSAEMEYLKTLEVAPSLWQANLSLALLYQREGKFNKAIQFFKNTIQYNPKNPVAYSFLASAFYNEGKVENAIEILEKAINEGIEKKEFYDFLGYIYYQKNDYEKAIENLKRSIEIQDTSETRFRLGVVYDKLGKKEEMEKQMKMSIELNPENALALNYLGYSYLVDNKNIKQASKMIKKAVEKDPKNGAFLDSLGWAYYKMGNYKKAKYYLEKAISYEKDPEVEEHLGYTYLKLKEYEKAISYFIKVYEKTGKKQLLKEVEKVKELLKNETH